MIFLVARWLFLHFRLGTAIVEEFLPSVSGWPLLLTLGLISLYGIGHHKGEEACKQRYQAASAKMEHKNEQIKNSVDGLSSKQLDKRLRKFRRD